VTFGRRRDRDRSRTLVRRDALGLGALLLLLLWLAPALARAQGADSLLVRWTAPGDDGNVGTAAYYELRLSTSQITAANFSSAAIVPGTPDPLPAGTSQAFMIRGLTRGTSYWLAMRTMDESGNWSAISNIVRFDWPQDAAPPAAPTNVAAVAGQGGTLVRVSWSANTEPDLAGYRVYRAVAEAGPWTRVATPAANSVVWSDTNLPADVGALWYRVSAVDRSGNEGARSAAIEVSLQSPLGSAPVAWGIEAVYPNPATAAQVSHLPVTVPAGGGAAHVDLLDGTGRLVRRFDLSSSAPGAVTLSWDGTNEAGRPCAPGVYRAVLEAPGVMRFVLVARVP
jgi:hypothetical protein